MFVHAREADSPTNMRYMGLLVDKYVPDPGMAKGSSWAGAGSSSPLAQPPFVPTLPNAFLWTLMQQTASRWGNLNTVQSRNAKTGLAQSTIICQFQVTYVKCALEVCMAQRDQTVISQGSSGNSIEPIGEPGLRVQRQRNLATPAV
jgi:hypothetical protein